MKVIWRILAVIVGAVFVYAGVLKAFDPVQFANDVDNYKILPWTLGVSLALYLPWLEILCGLAVVSRIFHRGALWIFMVLVAVFIAATVAARARGLDITCGCFGHASQHWSFPLHMIVDLAILIALAALLWSEIIMRPRDDQKS